MTMPSSEHPPPEQAYPGRTGEMDPEPHDEMRDYSGEVLAPIGGETLPG